MNSLRVALISNYSTGLIDLLATSGHLALVIGPEPVSPFPERFLFRLGLRIRKWLKRASISDLAALYRVPYRGFPYSDQAALANWLKELNIDLLICFGGTKLIPEVLSAVKLDALNCHPSLLPDYAGGNPLLWQVLDGVGSTGVSVHRMTDNIDMGELVFQKSYRRPRYSSKALLVRLADQSIVSGIRALMTVYERGQHPEVLQKLDHYRTQFASNVKRSELPSLIDWQHADPEQMLQLSAYLDKWPVEMLPQTSWIGWLPWRAVEATTRFVSETPQANWYRGKLYFSNQSGSVRLKPLLDPLNLFRHQKERRMLSNGKLKTRYL